VSCVGNWAIIDNSSTEYSAVGKKKKALDIVCRTILNPEILIWPLILFSSVIPSEESSFRICFVFDGVFDCYVVTKFKKYVVMLPVSNLITSRIY
jgi:hypothetical protein